MSAPDDRWTAGDAYEAYMGRWSRRLAREFVEWLRPSRSAHWLEVGCGTGALTATLCQLASPASVVACDPSEPFVQHARSRISDPRVSFVVADARDLPERDGGFDVVVSGLVLNFVPDPEGAVSSMRARLRSGGSASAYVWDYARGMEFLRRFWDAAIALDPTAASLDEGHRFPLCQPDALASLFAVAGLRQIDARPLEIHTDFADFDDYWRPFLGGAGPAPAYAASLDPTRRDLLHERLRESLSSNAGPITLVARAWAVRGSSP